MRQTKPNDVPTACSKLKVAARRLPRCPVLGCPAGVAHHYAFYRKFNSGMHAESEDGGSSPDGRTSVCSPRVSSFVRQPRPGRQNLSGTSSRLAMLNMSITHNHDVEVRAMELIFDCCG